MNAPARTRVFKTGNSVAVRLPKAFGLAVGTEMEVVQEADGGVYLRPVRRKIDLTGIAGTMPWLKPLPREDFDDPERDWHLLGPQDAA
ncbi:MAG: AbrB/MazE/SpoVT family DNA-binding domain-containing protein [Sphingomonas fennica]